MVTILVDGLVYDAVSGDTAMHSLVLAIRIIRRNEYALLGVVTVYGTTLPF